jgi:hypothetical protein
MKILIIDDKEHAAKQLAWALSTIGIVDAELTWIDHLAGLEGIADEPFNLAFVDYFLSNDRTYGTDIIGRFKADAVVGFSSKRAASEAIAKEAEIMGYCRFASVEKIKECVENPELVEVLKSLMACP